LIKTRNGSDGIEIIDLTIIRVPRSRKEISVNFSLSFNKKSTPIIDETIDKIWQEVYQKNQRLYNGSKFRFSNSTMLTDQVLLDIGLTCYKDLLGTNCNLFGKELREFGLRAHQDARSYFADVLGVGSLLLTKDDKFLFIKRAMWTGEDKGKIDRPGGHPEPDNISQLHLHADKTEHFNREVREEIFNSVLNEVRDEINLPLDTLSDPLFFGIVRSLERFGRPSAEFLVRCSLNSDEVETLYSVRSQVEADESEGIIFIPEEHVRRKKLEEDTWKNLTDATCGAIELYNRCYDNSSNDKQ